MRDMRELTEAPVATAQHSSRKRARMHSTVATTRIHGRQSGPAQEKLRAQLGGLTQQLVEDDGGNLEDFNAADSAMGDAATALKAGAWQSGARTQGVALARRRAGLRRRRSKFCAASPQKACRFGNAGRRASIESMARTGRPGRWEQ